MQTYINNPMIASKPQEECVFCLDAEPPPLIKNSSCACQYNYHSTCQKSYEARLATEGKQPLCVMCRQPLSTDCEIALMAAHCQAESRVTIEIPNKCCYRILIAFFIIFTVIFLLIAYRLFF